MLVAVTGSTGLIGSALVPSLVAEGHEVLRFTRSPSPGPGAARWDPAGGTIDSEALSKADAVAHLAGRSIAALRWTPKVKREILSSRTQGTRLLAEAMAGLPDGPRVLVTASGINFYGDRGDEVLTETSPGGSGFLADVCRQWEGAADPARAAGIRTVHVRTGFVQTPRAGVLPRLLPLFRVGLGGRFGSGRQWWSWVTLDDVVGIYRHAVTAGAVGGALNATAPNPVTNAEFTATLARAVGRHRPKRVEPLAQELDGVAEGREPGRPQIGGAELDRAHPGELWCLGADHRPRQPIRPRLRHRAGRPER